MNNISNYKRIGTDFYKEVLVPMTYDKVKCLKKWQKQTIIDDLGKDSITKIKNILRKTADEYKEKGIRVSLDVDPINLM